MSLVVVASAKSSPGATTLAELLVTLRPSPARCVLVDCDPAGGEWMLRPGVTAEPGLVTLAMAGRRDLEAGAVFGHLQTLAGMEVLIGPAAARQAASALEILGDRLGAHLRALDAVDVVADCGRLAQGSPARGVVAAADLVVVVARPTAPEMIHVASCVEQLQQDGLAVAVVLAAGQPGRRQLAYDPAEVAQALGAPVLGVVDHDPVAAARLWAHPGLAAGARRSRLVRSAQKVAAAVFAAGTLNASDLTLNAVVAEAEGVGSQ
ncbi:MAG TPA: hypothetical protein VF711_09675 [Acidimicrobiales bacterium]|jgi:MinD-like ATPase involved in chromosome partitioning or flagellar assembly